MPKTTGDHILRITVTDAEGNQASDTVVVPVAIEEKENIDEWIEKIPDFDKDMTFADKLLAVAESQLGYEGHMQRFIVNEDRTKRWYSVYGEWYGIPYEHWCSVFVAFCLEQAGIPKQAIPRSASCIRMKEELGGYYIDNEDEYEPERGDLIYFHTDVENPRLNVPTHIGIVEDVTEDKIYTIEGNHCMSINLKSFC